MYFDFLKSCVLEDLCILQYRYVGIKDSKTIEDVIFEEVEGPENAALDYHLSQPNNC